MVKSVSEMRIDESLVSGFGSKKIRSPAVGAWCIQGYDPTDMLNQINLARADLYLLTLFRAPA
jgi:hypothetical protein